MVRKSILKPCIFLDFWSIKVIHSFALIKEILYIRRMAYSFMEQTTFSPHETSQVIRYMRATQENVMRMDELQIYFPILLYELVELVTS